MARIVDEQKCINATMHTECPRGYFAWFDWAARMAKTHRQVRCPGCTLFAIWVPKTQRVKEAK